MLCAVLQTALGCPAFLWVQTQHSSQKLQLCVLDHTAQPEAATAPCQHLLGSLTNQPERQSGMANKNVRLSQHEISPQKSLLIKLLSYTELPFLKLVSITRMPMQPFVSNITDSTTDSLETRASTKQ